MPADCDQLPSPPSFTRPFPIELLDFIFNFLDSATLKHVSLASKYLHAIATRRLFAACRIDRRNTVTDEAWAQLEQGFTFLTDQSGGRSRLVRNIRISFPERVKREPQPTPTHLLDLLCKTLTRLDNLTSLRLFAESPEVVQAFARTHFGPRLKIFAADVPVASVLDLAPFWSTHPHLDRVCFFREHVAAFELLSSPAPTLPHLKTVLIHNPSQSFILRGNPVSKLILAMDRLGHQSITHWSVFCDNVAHSSAAITWLEINFTHFPTETVTRLADLGPYLSQVKVLCFYHFPDVCFPKKGLENLEEIFCRSFPGEVELEEYLKGWGEACPLLRRVWLCPPWKQGFSGREDMSAVAWKYFQRDLHEIGKWEVVLSRP